LANFQALTDSALSTLDIDQLLAELLLRVREILDADTAAVLLLDVSSGQLVATAACGIEEEVREGVRVQSGPGSPGGSPRAKARSSWIASMPRRSRIRSCGRRASK
jgi:hypothetical protein